MVSLDRLTLDRWQDWPTRFDLWLKFAQTQTLNWGVWDCVLAGCSHIDNITGSDLYAQHTGQYDSRESAAEYIVSLGGETLSDVVTAILGDRLPNLRKAQRGDIVLFDTLEGPACGIVVYGQKFAALDPSGTGLTVLSLDLASSAWRV